MSATPNDAMPTPRTIHESLPIADGQNAIDGNSISSWRYFRSGRLGIRA